MKALGIACLIVCLISVFVAVERYMTNGLRVVYANIGVERDRIPEWEMKMLTNGLEARPLQNGGSNLLEPVMPTITLYAGFFALLSGVTGVVLLMKSKT